MLKLRARDGDGKPVLIFGLSHGNLRRLKAGDPIAFSLAELGLEGRVLILAGPTEQAIAQELLSEAELSGTKITYSDPPPEPWKKAPGKPG